MREITPETLLTAGALILMPAKSWFWACYAVLMVLALAYALRI
jgi:hypothetical protein